MAVTETVPVAPGAAPPGVEPFEVHIDLGDHGDFSAATTGGLTIALFLTIVFVVLYVAALLGWIAPLTNDAVVLRLEPIIAVIIGYFFGRVPGEKNERSLKQEINRQARKARDAEQKKDQAHKEKADAERMTEALAQKVRDTRAALSADVPPPSDVPLDALGDDIGARVMRGGRPAAASDEGMRHTMAAALRVLDA